MSDRPPRDLDWLPDDTTNISVPSTTKQGNGWIVEKVSLEFLNWMWNRLSRWTHYLSGQSQEWIVIDSTNANEKDYDTLTDYLAAAPAAGDKVLVKEDQTVTAQIVIPSGLTIKFLDGARLLSSTNIATSVLKLGTDIIIEGVLNILLSQTGTTAKGVEYNGTNSIGNINVYNVSTGILTTAYHINAGKKGNKTAGNIRNAGGGTLTNIVINSSGNDSNSLVVVDEPNGVVIATGLVDFASAHTIKNKTLGTGSKIALGSDADGDIYYRDAGILKRLAKGSNGDVLNLASDLPSWFTPDGKYTPTLTGILNVASSTVRQARFTRSGDMVTVSGQISLGVTSAGVRTQFRITLPVAGAIIAVWSLSGSGGARNSTTAVSAVDIEGSVGDGGAKFTGFFSVTAGIVIDYMFMYEAQ